MQPALAWRYAPRPGALPVGSACTPPSEGRNRRIRSALPAPCRAERRRHESLGVIRPRNDVHVLVRELAQDRAVPHPLRPDARPDRVETRLARRHRDLGPQTWFTGDGADLHCARLDLRHLGLEEAMDEGARPARNTDLRLPPVVLRVEDDDEDRAAGREWLA